MQVNHKRVVRIMREDNLLAIQPKCFKLTTNSNHKGEIYLNLASRMKLTGINQFWVADITYIRLKAEFVCLAVILDGFSRKVVGWELPSERWSKRSSADTRNPAWCITPIEGCNTLARNISPYSRSTT
jgi:transposase InsO family protein